MDEMRRIISRSQRIVTSQTIKVKLKPRLGKCYICFGFETKSGVERILVNFQDRPMFSDIIRKVSARAFH